MICGTLCSPLRLRECEIYVLSHQHPTLLVFPQGPPSIMLENSANTTFNVSGVHSQEEVSITIYDGISTFAIPGVETRIVLIGIVVASQAE